MSKHTKGPWKVINKTLVTPIELECGCEQTQCEECEANARLIAAAPELLSCLIGALDYVEVHEPNEGQQLFIKRIKSVINKAEGKE